MFLSTSKDSTLYQHAFKDAERPADHANPMGLDINCCGDIILASSEEILNESVMGKHTSISKKLPVIFRKNPTLGDQFPIAVSSCLFLQNRNDKVGIQYSYAISLLFF